MMSSNALSMADGGMEKALLHRRWKDASDRLTNRCRSRWFKLNHAGHQTVPLQIINSNENCFNRLSKPNMILVICNIHLNRCHSYQKHKEKSQIKNLRAKHYIQRSIMKICTAYAVYITYYAVHIVCTNTK